MNVQQSHPLIPREQTFVLDRKILSVHSIDRDIKKWPKANYFEVDLPETLNQVQSMRLVNISLPNQQYVFSNEYQNTKMTFTLVEGCVGEGTYTIMICEGSYTPYQLTAEIESKMNKAVKESIDLPYNAFKVHYNAVTNKICFGNTLCGFELNFDVKEEYPPDPCPGYPLSSRSRPQIDIYRHYKRWGLPAYLGYSKKKYVSTLTPADPPGGAPGDPFKFDFESVFWLNGNGTNHYVDCSQACVIDIMGDDVIYMEMEKYNTIDEIEPYSENTMGACNNDYNGKVNSAFAKIPVPCPAFSQIFDSRNAYLTNISHYQPPIERITRLRFAFRYHDGRLVDFRCVPFSFSLEFNMLKDEQLRAMYIRVPPLYNL